MQDDIDMFKQINPNKNYVNSIFHFDVSKLNQVSSLEISQYVIALSQYLIYFKFQFNQTKMRLNDKQRLLEATLFQLMTPEYLKKYKTKAEARNKLIYETATLSSIQIEIEALQDEVYMLQGIDKTISELIASFKRELTRRENELYQERHS